MMKEESHKGRFRKTYGESRQATKASKSILQEPCCPGVVSNFQLSKQLMNIVKEKNEKQLMNIVKEKNTSTAEEQATYGLKSQWRVGLTARKVYFS